MLIGAYRSHEKTENGWLLHADGADVLLIFLSDDVIRVRVSFDRRFPEQSYTLVTTAWADRLDPLFEGERRRVQALDPACDETANSLRFSTRSLTLTLRKDPFSFSLADGDGRCFYRDLTGRAFEKDCLGRLGHYSRMDREKDHFFGFGEKTGWLDKKGRRMRMSPKDAIGHDPQFGDPLYKHVPFYIRVNEDDRHALGLFYHNSYDAVFDMGQEISGYWERYCSYQTEGGDIDLFLLNGPDARDVIRRYTWLTGSCTLPPKQALGCGGGSMYYAELEQNCDQEIYKAVDKQLAERLWIDNFWLSSGYTSGEEDNLRYTFHWNRRRFPDPEGFFEKMNERGIGVICNVKPGVLKDHPHAAFYEKSDAFIKKADGSGPAVGSWWGGRGRFVDFTSPRGREAWKTLLTENLLQKGCRAIWDDNCELDGIEDLESRCDFEGAGGSLAELRAVQANMMAYTAVRALRESCPNERPYVVSRAGFAGIQRYAQVWSGDNTSDWRSLKFNVATILGMGLSGCANTGCDIGGFTGPAPEGELLLRWIQNGIFQPRFAINSANTDNSVTQPWMYEKFLPQVRAAYALRCRMLPYLYSLLYEANRSGLPVLRPLFLEFPDDPACYADTSLSFLFGPGVLVANVLEKGAGTRCVYLPAGCSWYDMNDELREYKGGQTVELPVDLDSIPMFLRGGAVFFTTEDVKRIRFDSVKQLDLLVSADSDSSFVYYDDDGRTEDCLRGVYARTTIRVTAGERSRLSFSTEGSYPDRPERLTLRLVSKEKGALWVSVDGRRLPRTLVRDTWEAAAEGWYYELSDRTVRVKCPWPDKAAFEIVVSTEPFDLIGMDEKE